MRKLWIILLILLLTMGAALAEEPPKYHCGEYIYTIDEAGNATITDWRWWELDEAPTIVEVPATLNGHPVTTLGDSAFNTSEMSAEEGDFCLVIPEGVTGGDGDPFMCCHNAAEIVLPASFTGDLEGCFHHVWADFIVADGNPAYTVRDGYLIDTRTDTLICAGRSTRNMALPVVRRYGNSCLDEWDTDADAIVIPEGVEELGWYVLYGATWEKHLILPESLRVLEPFALYGSGLADVHIPESITAIPEGCFVECFWDKAFTLPEHITFVGCNAFDEDVEVTALNPDCRFETEAEYIERTGEEGFYW